MFLSSPDPSCPEWDEDQRGGALLKTHTHTHTLPITPALASDTSGGRMYGKGRESRCPRTRGSGAAELWAGQQAEEPEGRSGQATHVSGLKVVSL